MPFASGALLRELIDTAAREGADVVAPASDGPRGVEPLCAFYSNRCAAAIEAALAIDDLRMIGFYEQVKVATLPLERVRDFGDPAALFMNVNTHEELAAAQRIAEELSL
jgi:molybdopterin-guanine dinucleotide biosynthesis protein A